MGEVLAVKIPPPSVIISLLGTCAILPRRSTFISVGWVQTLFPSYVVVCLRELVDDPR
jgi:hypothetical protein